MGPFVISGSPANDDVEVSYGPRRTVLDKLLVDAASQAGAEVREGFTVEEILMDGDRVTGIRAQQEGAVDRVPVHVPVRDDGAATA